MKNSYSSQVQRDSMFPRALLIYLIILVGAADALDVPFVFGETTSSVAGYTHDQFEKISQASPDLAGVPSASVPSENETLKFPIVGGSNTPVGANEKKVADLKKTLDIKVQVDSPSVVEEVGLAAGKYSGDYTIEQVSAIYDHLKENWHYLRDPRGVDYFKNASESLDLGKRNGCVGVGDCDDFAILMAALVESIGGTTRIILARNNSTGGHAYSEVYIGRLNTTGNQVDEIIGWLKPEYEADKIFTHIDTDTEEVWLNLDWGSDEKGNAHPGGPFYQGDKHYVITIRDTFGKTPLKLPEKSNKPPALISLNPDKTDPQISGTAITWTASAKDPDKDQILYRFFLNDEPVTDWSNDNSWTWTTVNDDAGKNQIEIRIRDGKHRGPNRFDDNAIVGFTINKAIERPKEADNHPLEAEITPNSGKVSGTGSIKREYFVQSDANDYARVSVEIKNATHYEYNYSIISDETQCSADIKVNVSQAESVICSGNAKNRDGIPTNMSASAKNGMWINYDNTMQVSEDGVKSSQGLEYECTYKGGDSVEATSIAAFDNNRFSKIVESNIVSNSCEHIQTFQETSSGEETKIYAGINAITGPLKSSLSIDEGDSKLYANADVAAGVISLEQLADKYNARQSSKGVLGGATFYTGSINTDKEKVCAYTVVGSGNLIEMLQLANSLYASYDVNYEYMPVSYQTRIFDIDINTSSIQTE
jgi:hypothetical protein